MTEKLIQLALHCHLSLCVAMTRFKVRLLFCLLFCNIENTALTDENEDQGPVLTVYHIHPDPYSEPPVEDTTDDPITETTDDTATTIDDASPPLSSTTEGITTQTTNRRPLCSTLKLETTTTSQSTETTEGTGSTVSTTNSGTTPVDCDEPKQDSIAEEVPSSMPAVIENDPIESLPADQWSICGSKFYNIWTLNYKLPTFKNGEKEWTRCDFSFNKRHKLEHADRGDQQLYGYFYVSNVSISHRVSM